MPHAVIMAGGPGERFWPLTHKKFPKYLIRLDKKNSLLQNTYRRLSRIYPINNIHIVTTKEHLPFIRKEIPALKKNNIILEPFRKNTAPAIFLSTLRLAKQHGSDLVVSFFPADHLIENEAAFKETIQNAVRLASKEDFLVTIGVQPTFPATGYGYIQSGSPLKGGSSAYKVRGFKEKPKRRLAQTYLKNKNYLWNGGIFTWRAEVFLEAMREHSPSIYNSLDLDRLNSSYEKLPGISIDYALLEKAGNMVVIKTGMDWCDMGSWDMYFEKAKKTEGGNFSYGRVRDKESTHCLFMNTTEEPLVTLGLRGVLAVKTSQGMLICGRTRSEEAALLSKNG